VQDLEGHGLAADQVLSFVDRAHASRAGLLHNGEAASELRTGRKRVGSQGDLRHAGSLGGKAHLQCPVRIQWEPMLEEKPVPR
jgi:hypothetical protein